MQGRWATMIKKGSLWQEPKLKQVSGLLLKSSTKCASVLVNTQGRVCMFVVHMKKVNSTTVSIELYQLL